MAERKVDIGDKIYVFRVSEQKDGSLKWVKRIYTVGYREHDGKGKSWYSIEYDGKYTDYVQIHKGNLYLHHGVFEEGVLNGTVSLLEDDPEKAMAMLLKFQRDRLEDMERTCQRKRAYLEKLKSLNVKEVD